MGLQLCCHIDQLCRRFPDHENQSVDTNSYDNEPIPLVDLSNWRNMPRDDATPDNIPATIDTTPTAVLTR